MKWNTIKLNEAFSIIRNGVSIKQSDAKEGIPITRIETIANGNIDLEKLGYDNIHSDRYKDYYLEEGDILMSHINSWAHLGKTALVGSISKNIIHGMNLLLLRSNTEIVIPRYAKYYFQTQTFKSKLHRISNQSVNQSSFSTSKLRNLDIPAPPLHIQQKIADTFDKADALRQKDQQLLQKYDELAQSIFYDMFGGLNEDNARWKKLSIGSITGVSSGSTPSRDKASYYNGNIPWVKTTEVSGKRIYQTEEMLTEEGLTNSSCRVNKRGSIIIAMYGQGTTRGKVGILECNATTNQACCVIDKCDQLNTEFLFFQLKLSYDSLRNLSRGGNQPNLNLSIIKNYKIIVPPLNLQERFSIAFQKIERMRETLATRNTSLLLSSSIVKKSFHDL